jgi:hypothetical protein
MLTGLPPEKGLDCPQCGKETVPQYPKGLYDFLLMAFTNSFGRWRWWCRCGWRDSKMMSVRYMTSDEVALKAWEELHEIKGKT